MEITREQAIKLLIEADDFSGEYSWSEWDHKCIKLGFNHNEIPKSEDCLMAIGVTKLEICDAKKN